MLTVGVASGGAGRPIGWNRGGHAENIGKTRVFLIPVDQGGWGPHWPPQIYYLPPELFFTLYSSPPRRGRRRCLSVLH